MKKIISLITACLMSITILATFPMQSTAEAEIIIYSGNEDGTVSIGFMVQTIATVTTDSPIQAKYKRGSIESDVFTLEKVNNDMNYMSTPFIMPDGATIESPFKLWVMKDGSWVETSQSYYDFPIISEGHTKGMVESGDTDTVRVQGENLYPHFNDNSDIKVRIGDSGDGTTISNVSADGIAAEALVVYPTVTEMTQFTMQYRVGFNEWQNITNDDAKVWVMPSGDDKQPNLKLEVTNVSGNKARCVLTAENCAPGFITKYEIISYNEMNPLIDNAMDVYINNIVEYKLISTTESTCTYDLTIPQSTSSGRCWIVARPIATMVSGDKAMDFEYTVLDVEKTTGGGTSGGGSAGGTTEAKPVVVTNTADSVISEISKKTTGDITVCDVTTASGNKIKIDIPITAENKEAVEKLSKKEVEEVVKKLSDIAISLNDKIEPESKKAFEDKLNSSGIENAKYVSVNFTGHLDLNFKVEVFVPLDSTTFSSDTDVLFAYHVGDDNKIEELGEAKITKSSDGKKIIGAEFETDGFSDFFISDKNLFGIDDADSLAAGESILLKEQTIA